MNAAVVRFEGVLSTALELFRIRGSALTALAAMLRLLCIKRASDARRGGDHAGLRVPEAAEWANVRRAGLQVGQVLNEVGKALEQANASLIEDVYTGYDFDSVAELTPQGHGDQLWREVVRLLDGVDLSDRSLGGPEVLGGSCMALLESRLALDRADGGAYTPRHLARLMVELLDLRPGMSVYDPACGLGALLLQAARHVMKGGGQGHSLHLAGQERSAEIWRLCRLNFVLNGIMDFEIERGDTLRAPKLLAGPGRLSRFDRVIAEPPFSLREWGAEEAVRDPYQRFGFGIPSRSQGDFAFIQHILHSLEPGGKAVVLVLPGVLFRGGNEGEIRRRIVEADLVEAVIGLPSNVLFGTALAPVLLVLSPGKEAARRDRVLFIDASREFVRERRRSVLTDEHTGHISQAFRAFVEEEHYARPVPLTEIAAQGYHLNLPRYLALEEPPSRHIHFSLARQSLREQEAERDVAIREMERLLDDLDLDRIA